MPAKNGGQGGETAIVGPNALNEEEVFLSVSIKEELEKILKAEDDALKGYDWSHLPEVKVAALTWLNLYHGLVFLAAALRKPGPDRIDPPEDDFRWKYGHRVPAFTIGGEGEIGWFMPETLGGNNILNRDYNHFLDNPAGVTYSHLLNNIGQWTTLRGNTAPLLKHFLLKLKEFAGSIENSIQELSPSDESSQEYIRNNWVSLCNDSIEELKNSDIQHDNTEHFVTGALGRFEQVWGGQIEENINLMDNWLPIVDLPDSDFETNLETLFPLSKIKAIIETENEQAKLDVGLLNNMLKEMNRTTYGFIYKRLTGEPDNADISHCLEKMVERLMAHISDDGKRLAWNYLIFAIYGSIVWQISQQLNRIVEKWSDLIPEVAGGPE